MTPRLADTPVLTTERLTLEAPRVEMYPAWERFFMSSRATFVGGGPDIPAAQPWRSFASITGHWVLRGFGLFVYSDRETGQTLGACGPWYPAIWPEPEIGWSVWHPDAEGKGYAHEAARAVLTHVFQDLGWDTAVSYVDPGNIRSQNLARRLGANLDNAADRPDPTDLVFRHTGPAA